MSILSLTGSVIVSLNDNTSDFSPTLAIDERMTLDKFALIPIDLDSDGAVTVNFNGMGEIHALFIIADGKVTGALTSADGTDQAISIDPIFFVMSLSSPYTGLKLTRVAGSANSIKVLAAKAV